MVVPKTIMSYVLEVVFKRIKSAHSRSLPNARLCLAQCDGQDIMADGGIFLYQRNLDSLNCRF